MNIHKLYDFIFKTYRAKRFKLFLSEIHPSTIDTLLDIGGYPKNWLDKSHIVKEIKIINISIPSNEQRATSNEQRATYLSLLEMPDI